MCAENSVVIKFSSCPHAENSIDISSPSCPHADNSIDMSSPSCPHAENSIDISSPSCPHAENSEISGELEAENSGNYPPQLVFQFKHKRLPTDILRWMACEKIVIFFNFIKIAKHTYSYAKFIVNSISENRFYLS